jgi:glucose/arabinose dehydrogenase
MGLTHASAMAFDPSGRLWVATADYTDTGQDTVSFVNGSGEAPVTVLRGQHTPLGLLWIADTLYVSSKERVDAYTGFDGQAFASQRTVVTFPAGVGELNGLTMSPDGRIVLGISAPCDHCVPTSEFSGSVVSFLPDGSDLRVDASTIRAPIGLEYFPSTTHLYVTMNQRDDLGDQTPGDWLSIVEPGQSWGFPDCYGQGGSACAGKPGPVAVLDPHAAVSGLAIVTGQLGTATGTAALVAEWSTGKVQRVGLVANGSAASQSSPDTFLTGIQNPFGLVMGPDQALYAGDWATGTIYRIGQ